MDAVPCEPQSVKCVLGMPSSDSAKQEIPVLLRSQTMPHGQALVFSLTDKRTSATPRKTSIRHRYDALDSFANAMLDGQRARRRVLSRGPLRQRLDDEEPMEKQCTALDTSRSLEDQYDALDKVHWMRECKSSPCLESDADLSVSTTCDDSDDGAPADEAPEAAKVPCGPLHEVRPPRAQKEEGDGVEVETAACPAAAPEPPRRKSRKSDGGGVRWGHWLLCMCSSLGCDGCFLGMSSL